MAYHFNLLHFCGSGKKRVTGGFLAEAEKERRAMTTTYSGVPKE
jgi:hypothetical protein